MIVLSIQPEIEFGNDSERSVGLVDEYLLLFVIAVAGLGQLLAHFAGRSGGSIKLSSILSGCKPEYT